MGTEGKRLIIFDFDGTLADTKELYVRTIYSSLLKHLYIFPESHIISSLGPKLEITLRNIGLKKEITKLKREINSWVTKEVRKLRLCPYAKSTLKRLKKKYKLALVSNSTRRFVLGFLRYYGLERWFDSLFCAEDFKNKPHAFKKLFKKFKVKPRETLYVADKRSDVKIAKKVGCDIVIVLACSWDKNKFKKERFVIRTLRELAKDQDT